MSRLFVHMRIHARCSVFRVALFRRAFALVVAFYLCRSPTDLAWGSMDSHPLLGRLAGTSWLQYGWVRRIVDARGSGNGVMQALKRPQKEKVKQFCVFTGAK